MRRLVGFCLLFALWASPAVGRDIFVNNATGDDRATGKQERPTGDLGGPVRTIAKALRLARSGDAIVLAKTATPYHESVSLVGSPHSGTPREPFAIRGNGATLDGSSPVPPKSWESYHGAVFRFRPPHTGYQQLFLDDRPAKEVPVEPTAKEPPELKPLQWCLHGAHIYFCVEKTKLPADYRLTFAREQTGITAFQVENVVVSDLTVQGFQLDGINVFNAARNVSLVNVLCRGNGRSGITVGGASTVTIARSRLGDNGHAQLLTLPNSETRLLAVEMLSNTAPAWVDRGGDVYRDGKRLRGGLDEFRPGGQERK